MFPIDPLLFKLLNFWGAIASIWLDGFAMFLALIWLQDYHADRTDRQGKVLFIIFATSSVLAFLFMACLAGILKPAGLQ